MVFLSYDSWFVTKNDQKHLLTYLEKKSMFLKNLNFLPFSAIFWPGPRTQKYRALLLYSPPSYTVLVFLPVWEPTHEFRNVCKDELTNKRNMAVVMTQFSKWALWPKIISKMKCLIQNVVRLLNILTLFVLLLFWVLIMSRKFPWTRLV